ncbi:MULTISPECIES: hypothetical protein [unclassified Streptomyces]|uniref:hypothetical protein n=1 Tax=unclassified Streptomyces TaxID=2593676 RepID=UPI002888E87C|nr:hypothetical protein [Streptomyces sp. DSM 41633]
MTLETALRLSGALVAASSLFVSIEYVVLARTGFFAPSGLLDWQVLSTSHRWTSSGRLSVALRSVFTHRYFLALLMLQAACSVAIGLGVLLGIFVLAGIGCLGWYCIGVLCAVRHPFGRDGADEMLLLLIVGLTVAFLVPSQPAKVIAVLFVCAQLTLSYFVAGLSKLRSRAWMREGVLGGILCTEAYGRIPQLGRWMRSHRRLDHAGGLVVVALEVAYPAVLVLPPLYASAWLLAMLGFHFATAIVMGLNTFLFVFPGALMLMYWLVVAH